MGVNDFPITFLMGTAVMITLSVLILCQFRKMEKKEKTVLSTSHLPAEENSDSVGKVSKRRVLPIFLISSGKKLNATEYCHAVMPFYNHLLISYWAKKIIKC